MHVTPVVWIVTLAVLTAVLAFDVRHMIKNPHEPSMKECGLAITGFVSAAILFGIGIGLFAHPLPESGKTSWQYAIEFFAGYLTEYSLSIDNLFVFIIILGSMGVPRKYQQFALMGLRQLYFLLGNLLQRLVYLSLGLAFILCFIAVKLVLHAMHHYHWISFEVPTLLSLVVIVVTIAFTAVLSLRKTRGDQKGQAEVDA